jgi:uncharacterized protein
MNTEVLLTQLPTETAPPVTSLTASLAQHVGLTSDNEGDVATFVSQLGDRERRALARLLKQRDGFDPAAVIGALAPHEILSASEIEIAQAERDHVVSRRGVLSEKMTVVMKATRLCNLRCTYCHSWAEGPDQTMSFQVLARTIRETTGTQGVRALSYYWHGGEVTLLKPKFFRKMIWLQQQFKQPGQRISNLIQTNATHMTDEWLDFLSALHMGVGISLDGPPELHDKRRRTVDSEPSSHLVREGIQKLRSRGIPFGVLMVVDEDVARYDPSALLQFFIDVGVDRVEFLNVVPENVFESGRPHGRYLPLPEFVRFLVSIFEVWKRDFRNRIQINTLEQFIAALRSGQRPIQCLWSGDCAGKFVTVEANGDIAPCDRQIGMPHSTMGNILSRSLTDILQGAAFVHLARQEARRAKSEMQSCRWFHVCQGGCPHDRLLNRHLLGQANQSCCGMRPLLDRIDGWLTDRAGE